MRNITVLYKTDDMRPADAPLGFECQAEDTDHAEEQCENAYPGCNVVWAFEGNTQQALEDYWS